MDGNRSEGEPAAVAEIELGYAGSELRLWQAREALRHAELRLSAQASSLQAFETRATAMLGWVALAVSTIAGAVIVSLDSARPARALGLCVALIPATIAAAEAAQLLWPKDWASPGYDPATVMDACESELQQLEYLVAGYGRGISRNGNFLGGAGDRIRVAWWALLATPLVAGAAFAITWAAGV